MRYVDFEYTEFKNFECYFDTVIYYFKNNVINLLVGPNGSGKTAIFDSVLFSLFGVTSKGLKSEDVVNNKVKKNCLTKTVFSITENEETDKYIVSRYVSDSKEGNTVFLYKNDKLIKRGHREVVPEIERILIPQKLFINTLFFGQKVKTFFTDLVDSEQKEIFRKVLLLDNYLEYNLLAGKRIKELIEYGLNIDSEYKLSEGLLNDCLSQINKFKNDKIYFEKSVKKDTEDIIEEIERVNSFYSLNSEEDIKSYKDSLKDLEEELLKNSKDEQKLNNDMNNLSKDKSNKILDISNKKKIRESEMNDKYSNMKFTIENTYNSKISSIKEKSNIVVIDLEKKKSDILSNIKSINKNVDDSKKIKNNIDREINNISEDLNKEESICFACKQKIGEKERNELNVILESKMVELSSLNKSINENSLRIDSLTKELKVISDELENINNVDSSEKSKAEKIRLSELSDLNAKFEEGKSKLTKLFNSTISKVNEEFNNKTKIISDLMSKNKDDIKSIKEEIEDLKNKIKENDECKNKLDKLLVKLDETKKREFNNQLIIDLELKEKNINEKLKKLKIMIDENILEIEAYEFWKNGFSMSGIPSMLIDEAIPYMNDRITFYLDQIGGRYQVSFDTVNTTKSGEYRDKIRINVLDTYNKADKKEQLSSGQVRLVDIATIFTLRDLQSVTQNMHINIMLLDEVFDSLDDTNISYVSNLLRGMIKGQSINIITHRNIDQIEADEVFRTI